MFCGLAQAASVAHKPMAEKQRTSIAPRAASALFVLPSMVAGD
jgi:hypothetical protein